METMGRIQSALMELANQDLKRRSKKTAPIYQITAIQQQNTQVILTTQPQQRDQLAAYIDRYHFLIIQNFLVKGILNIEDRKKRIYTIEKLSAEKIQINFTDVNHIDELWTLFRDNKLCNPEIIPVSINTAQLSQQQP